MSPQWLLRLYPRKWRERYEDEVRQLLAVTPATWSTCLDLLIGAAHEWVSPRDFRTTRQRLRWAGLASAVAPWAGGIVLVQGGEFVGRAMGWSTVSPWPPVGFLVEMAALARGGVALWASAMLMHRPSSPRLRSLLIRSSELRVWMAAIFAGGVCGGLSEARSFGPWWRPSPLFFLALSSYQAGRLGRVTTRLARRDRRRKIRQSLPPFLVP